MKIILLFAVFLVLLNSCSDNSDCRYLENRKVKIFFVKNNKSLNDTDITRVTVSIPEIDKILFDTITTNTLNLSLYQNSDTSVFLLKIKNTTDTLMFISTRKLEMISSDCGFNTRFHVDSFFYTKNNIIRTITLDANIDKDVLKNYFVVVKTAPAVTTAK